MSLSDDKVQLEYPARIWGTRWWKGSGIFCLEVLCSQEPTISPWRNSLCASDMMSCKCLWLTCKCSFIWEYLPSWHQLCIRNPILYFFKTLSCSAYIGVQLKYSITFFKHSIPIYVYTITIDIPRLLWVIILSIPQASPHWISDLLDTSRPNLQFKHLF